MIGTKPTSHIQPDIPRSCSLLTTRVIEPGTSRIGANAINAGKTGISIIAKIIEPMNIPIKKIFPPKTQNQYSDLDALPERENEFLKPLFIASINGIIFAGLPDVLSSIIVFSHPFYVSSYTLHLVIRVQIHYSHFLSNYVLLSIGYEVFEVRIHVRERHSNF